MGNVTKQGSKYTDEDRRQVAIEYLITGNMKKVSKRTGIPETTLSDWKRTEWWEGLVGEIRTEKAEELDAHLTKLIDSAFDQAQDRVDNGDFRVAKDGTLIRVPMGGRDLVIAGATVYDKQRLHRNQPTAIRSDINSQESVLKFLEQISDTYREQQARQANSIPGEYEEIDDGEDKPSKLP